MAMPALMVCGAAFVVVSFHPALRSDRTLMELAWVCFVVGIVVDSVLVVVALRWGFLFARGRLSGSFFFKSVQQVNREAEETLREAREVLARGERSRTDER
jgi:hypothetical protein